MKKLFLMVTAAVCSAFLTPVMAEDAWTDCTSSVQTSKDAWHGGGTYGCNVTTADGRTVKMVEKYDGAGFAAGELLYQEVTGLSDGLYKVEFYATANNAWKSGGDFISAETTEVAQLFATSGSNEATANIKAVKEKSYDLNWLVENGVYSVDINVTGGTLKIGTKVTKAKTCDWYTIQIKSLKKQVSEAEALEAAKATAQELLAAADYANVTGTERTALQAAIDDAAATSATVNAAIDTFKGAKSAYDAFVAAKTAPVPATDLATPEISQAFNAALNATPQSAEEATAAAEAIAAAYKPFMASNAIAEGADAINRKVIDLGVGAVPETPGALPETMDWTFTKVSNNAKLNIKNAEMPTGIDGTQYPYYDSDNWNDGSWNNKFSRTVTLTKGKYRLAVMARASEGFDWYYMQAVPVVAEETPAETASLKDAEGKPNSVNLSQIGSDGGVYGHGFNEHILDFEVTDDNTEIELSVNSVSNKSHLWESFTNFRLTMIENPAAQEEAEKAAQLAAAKEAAQALLDSEEYANVTGQEKTDLVNAIAAAENPADITEALTALNTAADTFKAAKGAYNNWADAKAGVAEIGDNLASQAAVDALTAALAANPANAAAATEAAATLVNANRAFTQSNSVAEGVDAAIREVIDLGNGAIPAAAGALPADIDWTFTKVSDNAKLRVQDSESPVLADGSKLPYYDSDNWNDGSWNNRFSHTVTLAPGKYRLAVMARASEGFDWYYLQAMPQTEEAKARMLAEGDERPNSVNLSQINNQGGVFSNGFNDHFVDFEVLDKATPVELSVNSVANKAHLWGSFTNFRLTRIEIGETGIENVSADTDLSKAAIYDLMGRRVVNPAPGLYIVNGKKTLIR